MYACQLTSVTNSVSDYQVISVQML